MLLLYRSEGRYLPQGSKIGHKKNNDGGEYKKSTQKIYFFTSDHPICVALRP